MTIESTIIVEHRFLQFLIREATEDLHRAKLRLEALQSRMPQPESRKQTYGPWRVPLSRELAEKNKGEGK